MIIAVDLDGTLCEEREDWWNYAKSVPLFESIAKVNKLVEEGHEVIIYTARPSSDYLVTKGWLQMYGVKYKDLLMEKFRADLYLDNNAKRMEEV